MYIHLDKQTMEIKVICGILERYEPTDNVRDICSKVAELKNKMQKFMEEEVEPALISINAKILEENNKYVLQDDKPKDE